MTKIKPLHDKIILKKVESSSSKEEIVKGGIIIPNDEKPLKYGQIIDISEDLKDIKIKIGDKVLYSEYSGKDIEIDNEKYLLISYKDIDGIIEFN